MAISVDWGTGVITIPQSFMTQIQVTPIPVYELSLDLLRVELRLIEESDLGMAETAILDYSAPTDVGGVTLGAVFTILEPYTITFTDGQYAVNIRGGNTNLGDRVNINNVGVRTSNSAGLVTSAAIEFGEYGGAVTVDQRLTTTGTTYPIGTLRSPVGNLNDAELIAAARGFSQINIVGDYVFEETDVLDGYIVQGTSASKTTLTLTEAASITNNTFINCTLDGQFDGGNDAEFCTIGSINYIDGTLTDCSLTAGTITLNGTQASLLRCFSVVAGGGVGQTPTVDMGGFGTDLVIRDYQGGLKLINHTSGTDDVSVDLSSGQIIIDATVSSGIYSVRGIGELIDESTGTAYVRDLLIRNTDVSNLKQLIELQRPHHTGTGKMIYWDPFRGDDTRRGDHIGRAVKTFAQAHNLATDNGHDVIVAVSGNPSGVTTTTENIVISKNYTFLRGSGRDFKIHSTNDALDTIQITGNGVEVSGMIVTNQTTSTKNTINVSGDFPLLENIYSTDSSKGFLIADSDYASVIGCQLSHNADYGLRVVGNSTHTKIENSHFGRNLGNGIEIDTVGGHDVVIGRTELYGNGGYGIDIGVSCENVMIRSDVITEDNTLGAVRDLGTATADFTGWVAKIETIDATVKTLPTTGGAVDLDPVLNAIAALNDVTAAEVRAAFNAADFQDKNNEAEVHAWLDSYANKDDYKAVVDLSTLETKVEADARQAALVVEHGITQSGISSLNNFDPAVDTIATLVPIQAALQVSLDELLTNHNNPTYFIGQDGTTRVSQAQAYYISLRSPDGLTEIRRITCLDNNNNPTGLVNATGYS